MMADGILGLIASLFLILGFARLFHYELSYNDSWLSFCSFIVSMFGTLGAIVLFYFSCIWIYQAHVANVAEAIKQCAQCL